MNFQKAARKIEEIISCKQISLSVEVKEIFKDEEGAWERFQRNEGLVDIFRIEYLSRGNSVVGFVIEPKNKTAPLPCIVYNRGGTREFGKIKQGLLFGTLAEMADWGYVVIASQYSGNDGGSGNDEFGGGDVGDIEILYEILKKYTAIDSTRIGMMGGSRGGMMTYLMLTRVSWIKAAVVRAGVANLFRNQRERPKMKQQHALLFGGSREELIKRSALYWPEKFPKDVPLLLMHGSSDWRVSPLDSIDLARKLYLEKVPHRLVVFEGADHGLTEVREEVMRQTREWFDRFVKETNPLPNLELHGA